MLKMCPETKNNVILRNNLGNAKMYIRTVGQTEILYNVILWISKLMVLDYSDRQRKIHFHQIHDNNQ